jgi:hypothetical protein
MRPARWPSDRVKSRLGGRGVVQRGRRCDEQLRVRYAIDSGLTLQLMNGSLESLSVSALWLGQVLNCVCPVCRSASRTIVQPSDQRKCTATPGA